MKSAPALIRVYGPRGSLVLAGRDEIGLLSLARGFAGEHGTEVSVTRQTPGHEERPLVRYRCLSMDRPVLEEREEGDDW